MSNIKTYSKEDVDRMVQNEYLGLKDIDDTKIYNVLMDINRRELYKDEPFYEILDVMKNPDYFYFTCKYLLNIHLLPFQIVILKELWNRKFPMLIASRGSGKTYLLSVYALLRAIFEQGSKIVIVGAAFRQSKLVFEYMETIWKNSPILQRLIGNSKQEGPKRDIDRCTFYIGNSTVTALPMGDGCCKKDTLITNNNGFNYIMNKSDYIWGNGKFRYSDEHYDNGVANTKIIKTKKGFSFEATHNHRMKICRNQEIMWVRADEMVVGDHILIDRSWRWHNGNFDCSEDEAYALGLMIGDGCRTQKHRLGFATIDDELGKAIKIGTGMPFKLSDKQHYLCFGKQYHKDFVNFWKLQDKCYTKNKALPPTILSATREKMTACLQGLFDSDGHVQVQTSKGGTAITVSFANTSKELVRQIQYILLHYGIIARVGERDRDENWNTIYELIMNGQDAVKFGEFIGFRLKRKRDVLLAAIENKKRTTVIDDTIPGIKADMVRIARNNKIKRGHRKKELDYIKASKLAVRKKITQECAEKFLEKYGFVEDGFIDRLKVLCDRNIFYDKITSIEDSVAHTYDMHVPDEHEYCAGGFFSHNSKIRGLRANYILADEFSSISQEIFEVVIRGFASVSSNPVAKVREQAKIKVLKSLGMYDEDEEEDIGFGNQIVISGTAYYSFNHFFDYWKRYKLIVESRGDKDKLKDIFKGDVPEDFDWTQFSVIRLPWWKLPKGFMDTAQIYQAKAQTHKSQAEMEYGAIFPTDSNGFFRRSLIERCVCKEPIETPDGNIQFSPMLRGSPNKEYIYGIDPASEGDNLAIVVLEKHENHRRIVYSWTMNRQKLRERIKSGNEDSEYANKSFYNFCARKIRNLMKIFPTNHIGIDSQGGGIAIMEALKDDSEYSAEKGEHPIWPWTKQGDNDIFWWEKDNKPEDKERGIHILHMINFANADFTAKANHALRKDFETKTCLFPKFDTVAIEEAIAIDKANNREYDTLEDCTLEIEELKDELATITHTQTQYGRDKWDTPEVKMPGGKKERQRKDRYSALVIANYIAHVMDNRLDGPQYFTAGGFVGRKKGKMDKKDEDQRMYTGPEYLVKKMPTDLYRGVSRFK